MRPGEQHGRDYFFVSKGQFEEWIAGGRLLEHAVVYGEYKGIPAQQVCVGWDLMGGRSMEVDESVAVGLCCCSSSVLFLTRRFHSKPSSKRSRRPWRAAPTS